MLGALGDKMTLKDIMEGIAAMSYLTSGGMSIAEALDSVLDGTRLRGILGDGGNGDTRTADKQARRTKRRSETREEW